LQSATQRWQLPPAATPLLILSDLGLLDGTPETLLGWQKFGGRLRSAGVPGAGPLPGSRRVAPGQPAALLQDRRMGPAQPAAPIVHLVAGSAQSRLRAIGTGRQRRLRPTRCSACSHRPSSIEPPLLRAMRHLLPAAAADVLAEALLWQHPDVVAGAQGCQFAGPAAIAEIPAEASARLAPEQQEAAVGLIVAHHAGLPDSVRLAELAACWRLAPASLPAAQAQAIEQWQHAIARTAIEDDAPPGLQEWLRRHADRQSDEALAEDELWPRSGRSRSASGWRAAKSSNCRPASARRAYASFSAPSQRAAESPARCGNAARSCGSKPLDVKVRGSRRPAAPTPT
jgi:hypothetical protein